jgi:hypothetical protein
LPGLSQPRWIANKSPATASPIRSGIQPPMIMPSAPASASTLSARFTGPNIQPCTAGAMK